MSNIKCVCLKNQTTWNPYISAFLLWQVEEARKKMFNGTISSVPQTFTVVTPQLNSQSSTHPSASAAASKAMQPAASVLQSLPCQLLGQTSLVLTPVANGSTVTCAPLALTVANQVQDTGQKCYRNTNKYLSKRGVDEGREADLWQEGC